jgi:hypothetical protein
LSSSIRSPEVSPSTSEAVSLVNVARTWRICRSGSMLFGFDSSESIDMTVTGGKANQNPSSILRTNCLYNQAGQKFIPCALFSLYLA